jgi:DNA-binding CsgD family transcriptional regulator
MVRRISAPPSPRLRQLLARARGILADPADPDAYPDDVLADPAGEKWPFERAQLRLEYSEWLRRRRGINDAKPHLAEALTVFRTLGAGPWTRRAETELRACGIAQGGAPEALQDLTPQQQQIIHLAAQGMSNREIGQRLFLSPRTVGSYRYHAFPKLGVAGRNQLHLVLAQADAMT